MTDLRRIRRSTPPVPAFAIPRPHLCRRLETAAASALTLVVAPPGFGKSIALAEWTAQQPRPVAWLTLDRSDSDAVHFAVHLVEALAAIEPGFGAAALDRHDQSGRALGNAFLNQLLDELPLLPDCVLVLDDLDAVANTALLSDIGMMIEHAGPRVRVVIGARADPAVPLKRLRVQDEISYLRQRDLAFLHDEAREVIAAVSGHSLQRRQIDALVSRTEGWPAGIVMAAITLRGADDTGAVVDRFAGIDEHVAGYLSDEVLARQPLEVQRFLFETSVLEEMSGSLCDAVTEGRDGHAMLDWLERQSLFVTRVDPGGEWFRYHRLFRDLLLHRLRTSGPERTTLLCRAASWYLERDQPQAAASYLIAAEDWDRLLELVSAYGRSLFEEARAGIALRWIDAVPRSIRMSRRDVMFQRAAIEVMVGSTLAAEDDLSQLEAAQPFTVGEQLLADVMRTGWVNAHVSPETALVVGDRALRTLASGEPYRVPEAFQLTSPDSLRIQVRVSMARAHLYRGDASNARLALAAVHEEEDVTYLPWLVHLLGTDALVDAWDGELRAAEEQASHALRVGREAALVTHPASVDANLAMARVLLDRDELLRAELILSEVAAYTHRIRRSVWAAILASELASLHLAKGDPDSGLKALARYRRAGHAPAPPAVAAMLHLAEVRLLVASGDVRSAEELVCSEEGGWFPPMAVAALQVAAANGDVERGRKVLESWSPASQALRSRLDLGLWTAVFEDLDGDRRSARRTMADVVALAEPQGHVRLFRDAGRDAMRVLRSVFEAEPTPFLRRLVQPDRAITSLTPSRATSLVEPLSERERVVLSYLPSRLSNAEIAAQLFVSLNTLKTHLRHIYRKLGVRGRGEAIVAAEELHLV